MFKCFVKQFLRTFWMLVWDAILTSIGEEPSFSAPLEAARSPPILQSPVALLLQYQSEEMIPDDQKDMVQHHLSLLCQMEQAPYLMWTSGCEACACPPHWLLLGCPVQCR